MMDAQVRERVQTLPKVGELFDKNRNVTSFSLPFDLTGYAVSDPGTVFDEATRDAVYAALVPVTTWSFGADMTPYWAGRRQQGYFARLAEFIAVADGDDRMVGWTGYSHLRKNGYANVYIDSSGMIPPYQGKGIMRAIWSTRLSGHAFQRFAGVGELYVSARSESPVLYKLLRAIPGVSQLYPNTRAGIPPHVLACGRELASWLGQADLLQQDSLTLKGAYAALDALYGELPSTGDASLDQLFRAQLGPLDAFLLVGEVNSRAATH